MQKYDKHLRCLKLNLYANANRAGKLLAGRVKAVQTRVRIQYLFNPNNKHKTTDPQEMANLFADYYGALYNLKDDPHTPKPSIEPSTPYLSYIYPQYVQQQYRPFPLLKRCLWHTLLLYLNQGKTLTPQQILDLYRS